MKVMKFYIDTVIDNGSGMKYENKEEFLTELSKMIDDCIINSGTRFAAIIDTDASCFDCGETD
jgi:hypothetical protein